MRAHPTSRKARGFTLVEAAVVLAIVGVVAALAIPSMLSLSQQYRGIETARGVLYGVTQARAYAQKTGAPFRLAVKANELVIEKADFTGDVADLVRTVSGFTEFRTIPLADSEVTDVVVNGGTQTPGSPNAVLVFCPSGDGHFVSAGTPVCRIGDLASSNATVNFKVGDEEFHIDVSAPLGTVDLRRAP